VGLLWAGLCEGTGPDGLEWQGTVVLFLSNFTNNQQHSAWCIGWSEAQRQAIYNDAKWQQGRYAPDDGPAGGLAAARMTAMLTYRSFGSFETRFGRKQQHSDDKKEIFGVQSYLFYQVFHQISAHW